MRQSNLLSRVMYTCISAFLIVGLCGCGSMSKSQKEARKELREHHNQNVSSLMYQTARQDFTVGNLDQALSNIEAAIVYEPMNADLYVMRGRILIEQQRLDEASRSFEVAIKLKPQHAKAHYYAGMIYQRWSDNEQAFEHYETAYNVDPANIDYLLASVEMLLSERRLDEASVMIDGSRSHFSHNAALHRTEGHLEMLREQYTQAADSFHQAMLLAPEDLSVVEDYASALFEVGDLDESQVQIERLLAYEDYQSRTDLRRMRAICLASTGRLVEARFEYISLTQDDPTNVDVWVELGTIDKQLGDYDGLSRVAQRLVDRWPDRYEGYILRGLSLENDGQYDKAMSDYYSATKLNISSAEPWLLLGRMLEQTGQYNEAKIAYDKALIIDPESRYARELLSMIEGRERIE